MLSGDSLSAQPPYMSSLHGSKLDAQMHSLEHSFVKNSVNQSYERLMAETIEKTQAHNRTLQFKKGIVGQKHYPPSGVKKNYASVGPAKSNQSSHKSLSQTKYESMSRKRSRRADQLQLSTNFRSSKCDSNRTKKNSQTTTLHSVKGIREARTKPTSPDRSFIVAAGGKKGPIMPQHQMAADDRRVLSMISNMNKKEQQQYAQAQATA